MSICGWEYVGFFDWVASYGPEVQAAWVSAIGTVAAAMIALIIFVIGLRLDKTRRLESENRESEEAVKREQVVLRIALMEFRSIALRLEDVILMCTTEDRREKIAIEAFAHAALATEKVGLENLRESLIHVRPELALKIIECEAEVALYNTEVMELVATRTARIESARHASTTARHEMIRRIGTSPFGIHERDARPIAILARVVAGQILSTAKALLAYTSLEPAQWEFVFNRCANHEVPLFVEELSPTQPAK